MSEREGAVEVACPSCHRLETWVVGGAPEICTEGGLRRPEIHPQRAAFEQIARSLRGEHIRVVGACAACGQPLLAPRGAPIPGVPWQISLPGGDTLAIGADGGLIGPGGSMTLGEAEALIHRAYPTGLSWERLRGWRPHVALFQGAVLTLMLGPLLAFLLGVSVLSIFFRALAGQLFGGP